jgi:hypothetical protein
MEHNEHNLKDNILNKIRMDELTMRPKIYFTLQVAALVILTLAVLVVSVFIFNFLLFSIRVSGHLSFLGFGWEGLFVFLHFFPWGFLLLDVALIAILESLLRRFRFGYKVPVLYLLGGLLCLTVLAALLVDRGTGFNDMLLMHADRHELPGPFGEFYEHARIPLPPDSGVCKCSILSINGNTMVVRDTHSSTTLTIVLPQNDPYATTTFLRVGDIILIAGDTDDGGIIKAFGVGKLSMPPQ